AALPRVEAARQAGTRSASGGSFEAGCVRRARSGSEAVVKRPEAGREAWPGSLRYIPAIVEVMHQNHRDGARERRWVRVRRVDECETLDELFLHCFPAFGGAYLRRIYRILDAAIGMGCPLTLAISGPVTVSGQHQAWLIPLLETGWVAYL